MYCKGCGKEVVSTAEICPECGTRLKESQNNGTKNNPNAPKKNKILAAVLALFLGVFGAHDFYLGNNDKGIAKVLFTTVGFFILCGFGPIITAIWAFIDFILILCGNVKDANGNLLV